MASVGALPFRTLNNIGFFDGVSRAPPPGSCRRVSRFHAPGVEKVLEEEEDHLPKTVPPLTLCSDDRESYKRVTRFVRYGVDIQFERDDRKEIYGYHPKKPRQVKFKVHRASKQENMSEECMNFKRVSQFRASGIDKNEGEETLQLPWRRGRKYKRVKDNTPFDREPFTYGSKNRYNRNTAFGKKRQLYDEETILSQRLRQMRLRHRKEAEQHIQAHHMTKTRKIQEKINEGKRDLKELVNYMPWGKLSAGVPKLSENGKLCTRLCGSDRGTLPDDNGYVPMFGGGKANGNKSERKGRPASSSCVPKTSLERLKIVKEKERQSYYVDVLNKQKCEEMEKRQDNGGGDGAGAGKPPLVWGHNTVDRNVSGKIMPRKRKLYSQDFGVSLRALSPDNKQRTRYISIVDKMNRGRSRISHHPPPPPRANIEDNCSPWGRPGAGAPLRNEQGYVKAMRMKKKFETKESSDQEKEGQGQRGRKGEELDVSSWMKRGMVGVHTKKIDPASGHVIGGTKNTSDVTAMHFGIRQPCRDKQRALCNKYYSDLQQQAENRKKERERECKADKKLEVRHFKKAGSIWDNGDKLRDTILPFHQTKSEEVIKKMKQFEEEKRMSRKHNEGNAKTQRSVQDETKQTFGQSWGNPGGGAPRIDHRGNVDAVHKSWSMHARDRGTDPLRLGCKKKLISNISIQ